MHYVDAVHGGVGGKVTTPDGGTFLGGVGDGIHTLTVDVRRGKNTSSLLSSTAIISMQNTTIRSENRTCEKKYQQAMLKWQLSEPWLVSTVISMSTHFRKSTSRSHHDHT